jgi:hypothetical protein
MLSLSSAFAHAADPAPEVDPALCQALVKHTPAPDVNYQPGVDVHGKPVAPADLPGSQVQLPSAIKIPLSVQLSKVLHLDYSKYPFNAVNGQSLSSEQQDNLAVLCMKQSK